MTDFKREAVVRAICPCRNNSDNLNECSFPHCSCGIEQKSEDATRAVIEELIRMDEDKWPVISDSYFHNKMANGYMSAPKCTKAMLQSLLEQMNGGSDG